MPADAVKGTMFFRRVKSKFGKYLAKNFPLNRVRIFGIRLCGYFVGKQVYIGPDLIIASMLTEGNCFLELHDRVAIGPRVTLVLSSDANWSELMNTISPVRGKIILENDCWLGAGAIVLPNITIGHHSIVAAGAVVTKDVPSYTVVAGVPAKILKSVPCE